ncbi:hypothetical protein NQZ79_g1057 [Umbelopsis isabellina]|nr:hypothetical protein NQZ79_g1057 [Umbelopsis isabellina]
MSTVGNSSQPRQAKQGFNYQDYIPSDSEIICPICQVQCTSLQRLNLHLDQAHNEEDTKGALVSWFKNAQKKVLTPLTQKSGTSPPGGTSLTKSFNQILEQPSFISGLNINGSQPVYTPEMEQQMESVSRSHWQKETNHDVCSENGCGKVLGRSGNGKQNCYHCGRLYCAAHIRYEMKLNKSAKHDPERGIWCRVCRTCYISRDGYLDKEGVIRSRTAIFLMRRAKTIDRVHLESNRLEKRLEKLAKIHANPEAAGVRPERPSLWKSITTGSRSDNLTVQRTSSESSIDSIGSLLNSNVGPGGNNSRIIAMNLKHRDAERSVVAWEDDRSHLSCPLCRFRRSESSWRNTGLQRLRKIQKEEMTKPQPIIQLYQQLSATKANIDKMLPRFQDMVMMLEKKDTSNQSHETFKLAGQVRKSLLDSFAAFDTISKRIKMLPAHSSSMRRLQTNIHIAANHYLQRNMFPLQMLPRILNPDNKAKSPNSNGKAVAQSPSPKKQAEIEELQLQLSTYEEQLTLVKGFVREAQRQRKFDDVKTLKMSLNELESEVERLRNELSKL